MTEAELRQQYVSIFAGFVGKTAEGSANHKAILAAYNEQNPLPRNVKMLETYDWCACTVTAIALMCGYGGFFAKECSCTKHIEQWQALGRWVEADDYTPASGDIIYFAWNATGTDDWTKDVNHVGVVESVEDGYIHTIEGNYKSNVTRRKIPINYKYIRGFATPDYASLATETEEDNMTRYTTIDDVPAGAYRELVEEYIAEGTIKGKAGGTIDLSEDMIRCMIFNQRHNDKKFEELNEKLDGLVDDVTDVVSKLVQERMDKLADTLKEAFK